MGEKIIDQGLVDLGRGHRPTQLNIRVAAVNSTYSVREVAECSTRVGRPVAKDGIQRII